MKVIGPSNKDEMVLAFVRAESASPVHRHKYEKLLADGSFSLEELVNNPDLRNKEQNMLRRHLLTATRGYESRTFLFTHFPYDVKWERALLNPEEIARLRYLNDKSWVDRSRGTRRVADGAANVLPKHDGVEDIATGIRGGRRYAELILVEVGGSYVVLEGNTRATAYVRSGYQEDVECLIGRSPTMSAWGFA